MGHGRQEASEAMTFTTETSYTGKSRASLVVSTSKLPRHPKHGVIGLMIFSSYPDRKRGIFNEGGLYGERMGWHRPEVYKDAQEWASRSLEQGLPPIARWVDNVGMIRTGGYSGIGFFRTHFQLNLLPGRDIMQSFNFVDCPSMTPTLQPYRAWIFVNGWMMGKRIANLGYGALKGSGSPLLRPSPLYD